MAEVAASDGLDTTLAGGDSLRETPLGDKVARATFMAVFVIVGFVGNSVLIAIIAQSQRLKVAVMNLFLISVAAVNVVEALVNMTLILGSSISERWSFGAFVCQLNGCCVQLASIVSIMGLMFMCVERLVAVTSVERGRMTVWTANLCIVCSWVWGLALSVPIVAGAVPVAPAYSRYLCSLAGGVSVVYVVFLCLLGYLLPAGAVLTLLVLVMYRGREKRRSHKAQDDLPDLWQEDLDAAKFVAVLFILWCVCQGPYLLIVTAEQFAFSKSVNSSISYPWQLELSFAWMRFGYVVVLPILTIFWRSDFRVRVKHCLLCRPLSTSSTSEYEREQRGGGESPRQKKESVPVLYVTAEGLGLQVADRSMQDAARHAIELEPSEIETNMNSDAVSSTTTTKCDVLGSQANLQDEQETSDWEEEDPLAVSNAQSVKSRSSHGSRGSTERSQTYVLDKPAKTKSKSSKLDRVEDEVDGVAPGNLGKQERRDSGHGSLERPERQEKKKKKKLKEEQQKLSADIERVLGETAGGHVTREGQEEPEVPRVKKRKKRRKREEGGDGGGYVNPGLSVEETGQYEQTDAPHNLHTPHTQPTHTPHTPSTHKPHSDHTDKLLFTKVHVTPEKRTNIRPLPQRPKDGHKTHNRTYSDGQEAIDSDLQRSDVQVRKTGKAHQRSLSEDWDMKDLSRTSPPNHPTPTPRKSKSKPEAGRQPRRHQRAHLGGEGEVQLEEETWSGSEHTDQSVPRSHRLTHSQI